MSSTVQEWHRGDLAALSGRDYDDSDWGVPDLLPDYDGTLCYADHPDGPICTRPVNHTGRHAASNGEVIVAVWPSSPNQTDQTGTDR